MTEVKVIKKAIKQSTLSFLLNASSIILMILCCLSFYFIIKANDHVNAVAAARYELFNNAKRFMEASAYLTIEVRAYAATGDITHHDNYWREVDERKNRDIAVENMRNIGITYHEGALVTEMYALSNNLIPLEKEAMKLVAAGDRLNALEVVYGWSYEDWISRIRSTQTRFINTLDERTEQQVATEIRIAHVWSAINLMCLAVTVIIQVIMALVVRRKIIRPLLMVRNEMLNIERGNLRSEFNATPDTSELGMLIGSMQATKAELSTYIREISEKLSAIANGDSTASIDSDYPGDFQEIKTSINEISQILSAKRDQDERVRKELQSAYEEAHSASQARSNFLSNMSHEIRTPMNAILGMTSIGLSSDVPARREYCLRKISDASNHLLGVINDILDMSKIDSGKFDLSTTEFNIEKMIMRVINIINFRVEEKRQKLRVHIDPEMPTSIVADDQHLAQVITNLLSNAVKFTPEGGDINVEIRLVSQDNNICRIYAAVTDSGIGISPEQQEKLFAPFSQADSGISRKFGGTGLGLAISRNIVEKMDGRIWVESEEGKGAKFAFEFTAIRGVLFEDVQPVLQGVKWDELRVLVADDDVATREYLLNIAHYVGFSCDVAESSAKTLEKVASGNQYDIFFIDWKMPDINGIELSRRLCDSGVDSASIIMISSTEWSKIEQDARVVGIDKFLPKPLFKSEIINIIAECMGVAIPSGDKQQGVELPDFSGYHILLAEDNEVNREIVLALLEPINVRITCAENGLVAVNAFAENPESFDMIFMDMQMPEMDGATATTKIRALDHHHAKQVPIVAMTANVFREDIERCLKVGMNDHVGKPLNIEDVLEKMKKYLGRKT